MNKYSEKKSDLFLLIEEVAETADNIACDVQEGNQILDTIKVYPILLKDKFGLDYISYDYKCLFGSIKKVKRNAKKNVKEKE